ncbi:MAG: hypothetical protein H6741_13060 [Alphaproteobacteria bacterium]|nr:hypothetical protein [Alphaproteobacteria bacterium]
MVPVWALTALVVLSTAVLLLGSLQRPAWVQLAPGWSGRLFGLVLAELLVLGVALREPDPPPPIEDCPTAPVAIPTAEAPPPAGVPAAWALAQRGDLLGARDAFDAALAAASDGVRRAQVQARRLDFLHRYLMDGDAVREAAEQLLADCAESEPACREPRAWAWYYLGVLEHRECYGLQDPRFIAAEEDFAAAIAGGLPVAPRVRFAIMHHNERKNAERVGLDFMAERDALAAAALAAEPERPVEGWVRSELYTLHGRVREFQGMRPSYEDEDVAAIAGWYQRADEACGDDRVCRAYVQLSLAHLMRNSAQRTADDALSEERRSLAEAAYRQCQELVPVVGSLGERGSCFHGIGLAERDAANRLSEEELAAGLAAPHLRSSAREFADAQRAFAQSGSPRSRDLWAGAARGNYDGVEERLP